MATEVNEASVKGRKPKKPRPIAWVDWDGCSGCSVCIDFCPVDCMYLLDSPQTTVHGINRIVVVDYDTCTGCTICVKECPWDTIEMAMREEVPALEELTQKEVLLEYA